MVIPLASIFGYFILRKIGEWEMLLRMKIKATPPPLPRFVYKEVYPLVLKFVASLEVLSFY